MKRFTLFLVLMCSAVLGFGQVVQTITDVPAKLQPVNDQGIGQSVLKGGGDIIWQTTFNWEDLSNPRGWTLPAGWTVKEKGDLGNLWVWRKDSIIGKFTKLGPPAWFVSRTDGFICLPMDEYNYRDGVATSSVSDAYIETPPIDCSKASSVVVSFNQYFRYCCQNYNLQMLVTNDGGVHWATYDVKYGTAGNLYTPERFRSLEINVSDVAAGLPNVQIRFYMHGPYEYFWMIDDLKLTEAFRNDLVLEDYWIDFDGGAGASIGQINYWPLSQMAIPGTTSGTVGNYSFKAALLNNGVDDAEDAQLDVKALKNGTQVFHEQSQANTIWTLERDTQSIVNPFLANDYGDYRFDFTGITNKTDEIPANNQTSFHFTVNDTLAFRADFTPESAMNTTFWTGGYGAGNMLAVPYNVYVATEVNSITAYIAGFDAPDTPQFQFVIFKNIGDNKEELISSEVITMDSTYMDRMVTLPVSKDGESEFLEPGVYNVCVRMWGVNPTTGAGTSAIYVGRDLSTKFGGCQLYFTSSGWGSVPGNPLFMIGYNINKKGGPTEAPVTFNIDMTKHIANGEFKPGTDIVEVTGSDPSWNGTASMTDPEGDGIYTATVANLQIAKVLHYKYRVNGTPEAYPVTANSYRTYTIRYWNIINDIYNGGITAGVDPTSLVASFNVYPNPTSGAFTVNVTNTLASDLIITLTNIQGQVIYQNKVANSVNYQETIDNKLSKGLYFLSINNGKEVKVQKVIVQ